MSSLKASAIALLAASSGADARSNGDRRILRKLSNGEYIRRDLDLSFSNPFGPDKSCGEKCDDSELCASFEAASNKDACNSGCVPGHVLDTCDKCDEASAVEKRLFGLGDDEELDEAACASCSFYRCCVEEGTGYNECKILSLLDSVGADGWEFPGWDAVSDIWGKKNSEGTGDAENVDDGSGITLLGRIVDDFKCPETCENDSLCEKVFVALGLGETVGIEDACDSSCVPEVSSCDDACASDVEGSAWLCDACEFLTCCGEDGRSFGACQDKFPDMDDVLGGAGWNAHVSALVGHKDDVESAVEGIQGTITDIAGGFFGGSEETAEAEGTSEGEASVSGGGVSGEGVGGVSGGDADEAPSETGTEASGVPESAPVDGSEAGGSPADAPVDGSEAGGSPAGAPAEGDSSTAETGDSGKTEGEAPGTAPQEEPQQPSVDDASSGSWGASRGPTFAAFATLLAAVL